MIYPSFMQIVDEAPRLLGRCMANEDRDSVCASKIYEGEDFIELEGGGLCCESCITRLTTARPTVKSWECPPKPKGKAKKGWMV